MPGKCPKCGATLPAGALAGLCPACLLQQGAAADTATHSEAKPFVPPTPKELARLFPQLEILGLLGKGGMGAVYRARQKQLDRTVALKILPPGIGGDPAFAERFTREARALARLNHPGIVTLYEFGQVESPPSTPSPQPSLYYFLMEFVDGVNLRQLLAGGRISSREALAIVPQICDALQYAHDQGIVHRDIKPENVLLDRRGRVKVADFGVAKLAGVASEAASGPAAGGTPSLTEAGKLMGTPQYMAPEQVENPAEVDRRADIYALGVVFYQMLTGELPGQPLVPPSHACGTIQIDARLDEVVLRALERKPELRYQQASVLKTQVETIAATPPTGSAAATPPWARAYGGVDYRSKATLFGLPLIHVASGLDPATGKPRVAKGIIALGGRATGVVAIGGVAMGGFAFGGLTIGVFTFGGLALGLLASGGLALGLIAAVGGLAIAPIALGGGAIGYLAYGGIAYGVHPWSSLGRDTVAEAFFGSWAPGFMQRGLLIMMMILAVVVTVSAIVPAWLQSRMAQADSGGGRGAGGVLGGGNAGPCVGPSAGRRSPWLAFCVTLTYAGTVLFGVLCELFRGSVPGPWLIAAFVLLACATPVLWLLLRRFASLEHQRSAFRVGAWLAFLTALPVVGFAVFFVLAMIDEGFGWHPAVDEAVLVPLVWLGALLLPVCGCRLWRAASRPAAGSTPGSAKPVPKPFWLRYAVGVLVALLLLVAIVGGAMVLATVLGTIRHAVHQQDAASAEFHYCVFEAEAAVVDRLIPPATRGPGVMPSVKPLTDFGHPVSQRTVGSFKMTVQEGMTESQMAQISANTMQALLDSVAPKPGPLEDRRRMVHSWPLVADSWSCSLAGTNFFGSCGGTGFLGARRKNGVLQARVEYAVDFGLDAPQAQPRLRVNSRILYEGAAPTNGALAFLVPFLRHNDVPRYLICLFEITPEAAQGHPVQSSPESTADTNQWQTRVAAMNVTGVKSAGALAAATAALPPEQGWAAVHDHWIAVTNAGTRQQFLKAFVVASHPRTLALLDLGLKDPSPGVQSRALGYLKEFALHDLADDFAAAQAWTEANKDRSLVEVMQTSAREAATILQEGNPDRVRSQLDVLIMPTQLRQHPEAIQGSGLEEALEKIISGPDKSLAELALKAVSLHKLSEAWCQRVLLPLLSPGHSALARGYAARALGSCGGDWAVDPLLNALTNLVADTAPRGSLAPEPFASALVKLGAARAIPTMIAVIDADNTYGTVYGVGYFGLGKLTGVEYDEKHDGAWWRAWWEKNKQRFSADVQALEIPHLEPVKRSQRAGAGTGEPADVADIPAEQHLADGDTNKQYFLIGRTNDSAGSAAGHPLLLVLPGGDGGRAFQPFIKGIYKNVLPGGYLVAQLVAPKWDEKQFSQVVWPTETNRYPAMRFSTEEFVRSVVADIEKQHRLDTNHIFSLAWSSGGPAGYAASLDPGSRITGSFIAMSVFKPQQLPDLKFARGHAFYLLHSPEDFIPLRMAEAARDSLGQHGAVVQLQTYSGGHGWHGHIYALIREGVQWLEQHTGSAQQMPSVDLKPIPPRARELAAEWTALAQSHASVHTMTNISEQAAFDQAANAWLLQIEEQLKGTVAEPVWQQHDAQAGEWKKAIQAKDAARAWAASRQVKALGAELARMLGLPEPASSPTPSPAAGFQFRWVAREGDTNSPADLLPCTRGRGPEQKLRVLREVVLDGDDVESAGFTRYGADQKELAVVLTLEASGKFAEATAKNVGRQLAVVWNGRVISAPIVQMAITSRNANIVGAFTDAEAQQLLDLLNHRAPVPPK